ncbi:glycoside hydrolase family 2, partial [Streptomyces sp. NPDC057927]
MSASEQDGTYPRPILRRERWHSLDGVWEFGYDDAGEGERDAWFSEEATGAFDREITVPFPPEALASGIGETAPHAVVWYRQRIPHAVLAVSGGDRALVHF